MCENNFGLNLLSKSSQKMSESGQKYGENLDEAFGSSSDEN